MFHIRQATPVSLTAALLLFGTVAHAQISLLQTKCAATKTKIQGNYAKGVASAEAKFQLTGDALKRDESILKADTKLDTSFTKIETKTEAAGDECVTTEDAPRIKQLVGGLMTGLAVSTAGARFVDNLNGTVTDNQTGLVWEKKVSFDVVQNLANPHDADNRYTWSAALVVPYAPNGTAFTDFLPKLNGSLGTCFAGKCDWRLPTHDELLGIADTTVPGCDGGTACINPIFGAIDTNNFWSSTEYDVDPSQALQVDFYDGTGEWLNSKTALRYLFAVRNSG